MKLVRPLCCLAVLLGFLFVLSGCGVGLLYKHVVRPLDINFQDTTVFPDNADSNEGDVKRVSYYIDIEWDSNAIGEIAKAKGMNAVYYADLETFSILLGIWTQERITVYGR